jgi:hypothetical protein
MRQNTLAKQKLNSSLYSREKDAELIIKKLFVESQPYSNELKKLLVVNTKDCLDDPELKYQKIIEKMSVKDLMQKNYITLSPKIKIEEHEEIKSYIVLSFDNFVPNGSNPEFRDCNVFFDIFCHPDYWDLGNFRLRPIKIAGIIDGLLNGNRLTGIGTFQFSGMTEIVSNDQLAGYTLAFSAVHGNDDNLPPDGELS